MTDMGFMPQVTALLDQVAPDGQRMLFSATLDRNVDRLVRRYLTDPVVHSVDPSAGAVTTMEHHVLHVQDEDKQRATVEIAAPEGRVIMFLDTKHRVDRLVKQLLKSGVRAAGLHGGKSQPQRTRTLAQFKDGQVTALVATNVAARGIHVDNLDLVVNVDPPGDHKDYLHRGGRTALGRRVRQRRHPGDAGPAARDDPADGLGRHHPAGHPHPSGEAELARITGAQAPSGVPVVIAAPVVERPRRAASGAGSSSRGRRSRPSQGRGGGQGAGTAQPRTGQGRAGQGRPTGESPRPQAAPPVHGRLRRFDRLGGLGPLGRPGQHRSALTTLEHSGTPLGRPAPGPPGPTRSIPLVEASCAVSSPGTCSTSPRAGCWTR
ncbi:ATP-dependent RNA helicase RhlB [Streptomyces tendae]